MYNENSIQTTEDNTIPPVDQIRKILSDFEMRVPVWGLSVFTVDGYILAHKVFYDEMPRDIEMAVSSMSAGLITISENFIQMVNPSSEFNQVLIDSEGNTTDTTFSIILKHVAENVMLACVFPNKVQLGLVSFELQNLCQEIVEIVNNWDIKLHPETVT